MIRILFFASLTSCVLLTQGKIRSDPIIILECDPLGTLWRMGSHHHCVCRPYFFGEFCHRIRRCVSGRPVTVNCTIPEQNYAAHAQRRCSTNMKSSIDVCDCFHGYTGPLCEHVGNRPLQERISFSDDSYPLKQIPHQHQPDRNSAASWDDTDVYDLSPTFDSRWLLFLMLHLLLVICAVVCVSLTLSYYFRQKAARSLRPVFGSYARIPIMHPKPDSKLLVPPPNYEEATSKGSNFAQKPDASLSSQAGNAFAIETLHITHKKKHTLHVTTKERMVHIHV